MTDCFVSYSRHDQAMADIVCRVLRASGLDVFMAASSLTPGVPWSSSITESLAGSRCILFLASKAACGSPWVQQELGMAIGQSKKIIPVVWDMPPGDLPGWVSGRQAVNLNGASFGEIETRMSEIADQLKQESLSERDGEVHRVLTRVDATLAGLFWFLVRAISEVERPGGVQMLGHAGRELSLGVIRYLGRDAVSEDTMSADDKFRSAIARALRHRPSHPSVSSWLKVHKELVACSHYPKEDSDRVRTASEALEAGTALTSLLWSAVGPFFQAKADITRLLSIDAPSDADLAALKSALARPTVRWEFFKALEKPGWVAPLFRAGFFRQPPDISPPDRDGKQSWDGWAEGDYLRRMAAEAPAQVRDVIAAIPASLRNPYVWNTAARAALDIPTEIALSLIPLFRKALSNALPWLLQETLCDLAVRLAKAGHDQAFGLARDAVRVVEGTSSLSAALGGNGRKDAALFGLDEYEAEKTIPQLADALGALNVDKGLKFLVHRLDEALKIEWGSAADEPGWDSSRYWCPELAQAHDHHGFKEYLGVAIARLAAQRAQSSPEEAVAVLSLLRAQPWAFYRRVILFVLAHAGANAREDVNAATGDLTLVRSEYPLHEYSLLLENQFAGADQATQDAVVRTILDGPGNDEELRAFLRSDEGVGASDEDLHKFRVRWQRKRLRRFGDAIPTALAELAAQSDADESVPKPTGAALELEDTGSSGGVSWVSGAQSPLTDEQLDAMSVGDLTEFLRNYRPARDHFESPTPAGLASLITGRVRRSVDFGLELIRSLPDARLGPMYVRAIVQGIAAAITEGQTVAWTGVAPLVEWLAVQSDQDKSETSADFDYEDPDWTWAQREVAKLVSTMAAKNLVAPGDLPSLWSAANALLASRATWNEAQGTPVSMDGALSTALNTLAGDAVQAMIDVALCHYRLSTAANEGNTRDIVPFEPERLRTAIGTILSAEGNAANTGRLRLGQFLPQLLLMDHDWTVEHAPRFFEDGFTPPLTNPFWGGYITSQRFYDGVYRDFADWYLAAARALPVLDDATLVAEQSDATWSTTRHLVEHALLSVIRGLTQEGDEFLTLAFERSPVSDRSHAYWGVVAAWKGEPGDVPPVMVERLEWFWEGRLTALAGRPAAEQKAEADGLGWLATASAVPDEIVLKLLPRTTQLADGHFRMGHSMWGRLVALAELDAHVTIDVIRRIVHAELWGQYPHFNVSDVGPVLERVMSANDANARQRAIDLINLLGDRGFTEFGSLL